MDPEVLFSFCNLTAMAGWLLLIFAPGWKVTRRLVLSGLFPLAFAVIYMVIIIWKMPGSEGGFGSLVEVSQLFQNPYLLLVGWIHYLAFDLFVGSWEVADARKRGIRHGLVIPCLLLTFFLGPIGFLSYMLMRGFITRKLDWANF